MIKNNNIKQTVCKWCYDGKVEPEKLFSEAAKMGYKGIDLVGPKDWPLLKKYNLVGTMTPSHGITKGLNRKANWDECLKLIRDGALAAQEYYRELLRSDEGISSNILAERLARLVDAGILSRTGDPTHKQKAIYSLTPMGIDLLPIVAQLGIWGGKYLPVTAETGAQAEQLQKGGAALLRKIQADLRKQHLSEPVA